MKIFGYCIESEQAREVGPRELAEISLVATADELRRIAVFLADAADSMDRMGSTYDHEHLCDRQPGFEESPQIVVARSASFDR